MNAAGGTLWPSARIDEQVAKTLEGAQHGFDEDGEVRPYVFVLATKTPKGEPTETMMIVASPDGFDHPSFVPILKKLAVEPAARGVIFVAEAWTLKPGAPRGNYDRLADHPDRVEALIVTVERVDKMSESYLAPILREPDGKATLGAFRKGGFSGGRLKDILRGNEGS